jgi:SPASM domain peptide maturase of grasp-with-spasm system
MKKYFKLYSNCIIVKGAKNVIVCDIQLNRYLNLHSFISEIFTTHANLSIFDLEQKFGKDQMDEVTNYFIFLDKSGYGFFTDHPAQFPPLGLNYETPTLISNSILDYNNEKKYNLKDTILKLDKLGCVAIQIRIFDRIHINALSDYLDVIALTSINSVEVLVKNIVFQNSDEINLLLVKHTRLRKLYLFNQQCIETIRVSNSQSDFGFILSSTSDLISSDYCGNISPSMFHVNIDSFSEATTFNSCLNKKISIDIHGNIKNCPSMKVGYGKIDNVKDLDEIVNDNTFKESWLINKDKVKVCRDCEFRYICTDCRAFLKDQTDLYSKPLKCGYNPYVGIWEEI